MTGSDEDSLFASILLSPIATVVTDPGSRDNPIVAVNGAFERLTGYTAGELVGRNCRLLAGPATEADCSEILRAAVADRRPAITELTNYRRDGTSFRNVVMIAPIFDQTGELVYFIGSQMDASLSPGRDADARGAVAKERVAGLTERQRQVLHHMACGLRNKLIANALGINEKTVKMHRAALLTRLGAATSADAIRVAVEAGL